MKLVLLALLLLIASCAPSQPHRPVPAPSSGTSPSAAGGRTGASAPATSQPRAVSTYSQDAVECERKAALSQAGSKGEAFASCMRGKGHTPGRP
jgi:hypothetical protein